MFYIITATPTTNTTKYNQIINRWTSILTFAGCVGASTKHIHITVYKVIGTLVSATHHDVNVHQCTYNRIGYPYE